jgi:tetratricopeptide (TPR) repeat protein
MVFGDGSAPAANLSGAIRVHSYMRQLRSLLVLCAITAPLLAAPLLAAPAADPLAAGRAALDRGEHDQAVELFTKAIAAQPNDAQAHYLLGRTYGEMAQQASMFKQVSLAKQTRTEFERAVELDPNLLDARMGLISFYLLAPGFMGGGEDKAVAQAAEIKKRDALEGHRAYARVYMHAKKTDLARKEFVDAVREQPTSARAHYLLGGFLMNEKNWPGSLHEMEMALKLDPAFMPAYFRIGQYAVRSGTIYPRGEESLRKYLGYKPAENEPSLAAAWYWLGQLQEKQGKKAEARQSYLNAQKLAPGDTDIQAALKKL